MPLRHDFLSEKSLELRNPLSQVGCQWSESLRSVGPEQMVKKEADLLGGTNPSFVGKVKLYCKRVFSVVILFSRFFFLVKKKI